MLSSACRCRDTEEIVGENRVGLLRSVLKGQPAKFVASNKRQATNLTCLLPKIQRGFPRRGGRHRGTEGVVGGMNGVISAPVPEPITIAP